VSIKKGALLPYRNQIIVLKKVSFILKKEAFLFSYLVL